MSPHPCVSDALPTLSWDQIQDVMLRPKLADRQVERHDACVTHRSLMCEHSGCEETQLDGSPIRGMAVFELRQAGSSTISGLLLVPANVCPLGENDQRSSTTLSPLGLCVLSQPGHTLVDQLIKVPATTSAVHSDHRSAKPHQGLVCVSACPSQDAPAELR